MMTSLVAQSAAEAKFTVLSVVAVVLTLTALAVLLELFAPSESANKES